MLSLLIFAVTAGSFAPGDEWWSLQPLVRPAVPIVDTDWGSNPVDAFVLAKMREQGLAPSPDADRRTLLRRVSYDLTGLPPRWIEANDFLRDDRADAYEQLVDRLLSSPRYGERWGRHWLDVAHYADTHGFDKDKPRHNAWPYRDWVIRALNDDMSWSRFLSLQLAGDVFEPLDPAALAATGFVAAGPWDFVGHTELREGTRDKAITRNLDRDDMVATALNSFASVTAQCARCHDHELDPISQEDYYALQACFSGVERADRMLDADPLVAARRRELEEEKLALVARLASIPGGAGGGTNGWHSVVEARPDVAKWVQVDLGVSRGFDRVVLVPARPVDFPDTPGFGFPLRFRVEAAYEPTFTAPRLLHAEEVEDFARPGDVAVEISASERARYVRVTATRLFERTSDWIFALAELQVFAGDQNIARGATVSALDSIEAGLWSTRYLVDGRSSRAALEANPSTSAGEADARRSSLEAELRVLDQELLELPAPFVVYSVVPREPRPIRLLRRGEVDQPRQEIGPGVLSGVPGPSEAFHRMDLPDEGARRAALARWLSDPAHPLTWRSAANRVWQWHFGQGLVSTPNDLGRMGSPPTHPLLLDWLACEFRDGEQSLKSLHRLIVTSRTYRQLSREDTRHARVDAENRYLWRMNRRRLDAEELRDTLLLLSGELDLRMGGPGFQAFTFEDDHSPRYLFGELDVDDPRIFRRAVYRFVVRSRPDPWLETFDCADPSVSVPVRIETTTPLQALALMNDAFLLRRAERFAERVSGVSGAVRAAFLREPSALEREELEAYAAEHGLPNLCRVLFNSSELLFID